MSRRFDVYVELDTLLDTRLAAISAISPQAGVDTMLDPRYYKRVKDDFTDICGIGAEAFAKVYANRDGEMLTKSWMTQMPAMLGQMMAKFEQDQRDTPIMEDVELVLNTWPYEMDDIVADHLTLALMEHAGVETLVRRIHVAPKDLVPAMCKQRFSGMIVYNFRQMLEANWEAWTQVRAPRMSMVAPALFAGDLPDQEHIKTMGFRDDVDYFAAAEAGYGEMFSLDLLPARMFSLIQPDDFM